MRNYDTRHPTAEPECHAYWRGEVWSRNKPWRNESGTAFLSVARRKPNLSPGGLSPEMSPAQFYLSSQEPSPDYRGRQANPTATPQEEDPNPDFWSRQTEFHRYTPKWGTKSWLLG